MPVPLDGLCEEPAPVVLRRIAQTPQGTRARDITRIIIEPNAVTTLDISDRAVILCGGTAVPGGTAGERSRNGTPCREYPAIRAGGGEPPHRARKPRPERNRRR